MDRTIWATIVAALDRALRAVPHLGRRAVYSDRLIVLMLLWAVWHDRCLSWACDRGHYHSLFRPRILPSISRFSRRVKSERVQALLQHMHNDLAIAGTAFPFGLLSYIDAKPMVVSAVSKDPDAKRGRISGGFAKGYKFQAYINEHRRVLVWCVTPLNTDEKLTAAELIQHLPPGWDETSASLAMSAPLTLGDAGYDALRVRPMPSSSAAWTTVRGSQRTIPRHADGNGSAPTGSGGPVAGESGTDSVHHEEPQQRGGNIFGDVIGMWNGSLAGVCSAVGKSEAMGGLQTAPVSCQTAGARSRYPPGRMNLSAQSCEVITPLSGYASVPNSISCNPFPLGTIG
jgi:hypothetical protein